MLGVVLDRPAKTGGAALPPEGSYERHRLRMAARIRSESREAREISQDIPAIANPARRKKALASLRTFCTTYMPDVFYLPFSADHRRALAAVESAAITGGQFALAMPRGSGKTAIALAASIWVILTGRHEFLLLVGATKQHGKEMLESIKMQFATNDHLADDFPEVCTPIRRLEGIAQRRLLYKGELIRQEATKDRIILPSLPNNPAASACIAVAGITGRIRGLKVTRPDGRDVRPSFVVIDDPQTHKSAKSAAQCAQRERIINGDVLGLSGPDKAIAAVMPCTVIYPEDMADQILNRDRNPQWKGERMRLIYEWPSGEVADRHWETYAALWRKAMAADVPPNEATSYYRTNRKVMDAGSRVAWPERRYPGALSALQHAFNLRLKIGYSAFDAEYQNDPPREALSEDDQRLDPDAVAARVNRLDRRVIPTTATHLTAFIDVQRKVLFYLVAAWAPDFTGAIVDYGAWPDQGRPYWTKADAERLYSAAVPGVGFEGQLYHALDTLTEQLLGREWHREGSRSVLSIERCLIDSGWGESTDTVYEFCRRSKFRSVIYPSKGRGVGAAATPFHEYKATEGVISRHNWRISPDTTRRAIKSVLIDTNSWKSFTRARLRTPVGSPGALTLFGQGAEQHRMLADHLTSEQTIKVSARGRTVAEWQQPAPGRDNDWWDCLVGCAVAASIQGADLLCHSGPPLAPRRVSFAERQAQRQAQRQQQKGQRT